MLLYHGSSVPGIRTLEPRLSNHEKPYVYLTHIKPLAVLYAHNALTPPHGFFTYFMDKNASLVYEECFPNQLETLYAHQRGFVYTCKAEDLPTLPAMPWIYLSEDPVPVASWEEIPDLLQELLRLEQASALTIRRYETLTPEDRAINDRMILREIETLKLREHPETEYGRFLHAHFPHLL